jgi:hypothetical protein
MSRTTETVIAGVLKPDGTLELNQKPKLPPGPVTVTLRPSGIAAAGQPVGTEFFGAMDEIWAGQRARGHIPRPDAAAVRQDLRDQAERELEGAIRLQDETRRARSSADKGTTKG